MKKLLLILAASFMFLSCTSKIEFSLNEDGSVSGKALVSAGQAFSKLIKSSSGIPDDEVVFDTNQIEFEMMKKGFSAVKAVSKNQMDLNVTFADKNHSSALFTSGILSDEEKNLKLIFSPAALKSFYDSSDGMLQQMLDLLIAPVFNDEVMEEEEYIELIASFYGESVAQEVSDTVIEFSVNDSEGKKSQKIPLVRLLTLNENLILF